MALNRKKIKFKENKDKIDSESPKFTVNYNLLGSEFQRKKDSFEILSSLKGNSDIIIQIKSDLLNVPDNSRESFMLNLIKIIKDMGLDLRVKKLEPSKVSIFSLKILTSKKNPNYDVIFFAPNSLWEKEEFFNFLPTFGAKFYVPKQEFDHNNILDQINNGQMLDDEIIDFFKLIIFDCPNIGQMGIFTKSETSDSIKQLLGI
jgi:hypothetical protein